MPRPRTTLLLLVALAGCCCLLSGCDTYKASLLAAPDSGSRTDLRGAAVIRAGTDGGVQRDAAPPPCSPVREACNRVDDDCDGKTDEDTRPLCQAVILHADSDCVPVGTTADCVLLQCRAGYEDCDGNPANGCEPYCSCHNCPDAG